MRCPRSRRSLGRVGQTATTVGGDTPRRCCECCGTGFQWSEGGDSLGREFLSSMRGPRLRDERTDLAIRALRSFVCFPRPLEAQGDHAPPKMVAGFVRHLPRESGWASSIARDVCHRFEPANSANFSTTIEAWNPLGLRAGVAKWLRHARKAVWVRGCPIARRRPPGWTEPFLTRATRAAA